MKIKKINNIITNITAPQQHLALKLYWQFFQLYNKDIFKIKYKKFSGTDSKKEQKHEENHEMKLIFDIHQQEQKQD